MAIANILKYRILDIKAGDLVLPVYLALSAGSPTSGASGSLAGVAPVGALLLSQEPAIYQNTGTQAAPTWTSVLGPQSNVAITGGAINGTPIGATTPAAVAATTLSASGVFTESVTTGITAGTTHTLAGATALTAMINKLSTVANASDAVALPAATAAMVGATITVFNDGAHAAAVWPQAADAIDGGTAGAAVMLTNAKRCAYFCTAANVWESAQLGVVSA